MAVLHDRVQGRHRDPGFVPGHASIEPRFDAGERSGELRLAHGMLDVRVNATDRGFELGKVLPKLLRSEGLWRVGGARLAARVHESEAQEHEQPQTDGSHAGKPVRPANERTTD